MNGRTPEEIERLRAYRHEYSRRTVDRDVASNNRGEKTARIDLGLELLLLAREPGQAFSQQDVAAWAGCSRGLVYLIERNALRKLANSLRFGRNRAFLEECA